MDEPNELSEEIQSLAKTLKDSGLAASWTDAVQRAAAILGKKSDAERKSAEEIMLDRAGPLSEILAEGENASKEPIINGQKINDGNAAAMQSPSAVVGKNKLKEGRASD